MSEVESVRSEIKMAIAKKAIINDNYINIKDIISQLEKQGIIKSGDSNISTGYVRTQPHGFVFEIKQENGHWKVTYIGTGEVEKVDLLVELTAASTGVADKVTITMKATAESGITSYTLPGESAEAVTGGNKEIIKTYTATRNGTYTFTVLNGAGDIVTKSITIDNIIEDVIQISADKTLFTKDNVKVTIIWPKASSNGIKQIKVGEGEWQIVTGSATEVTLTQNAIVRARVKNTNGEIMAASLTVDNIDKKDAIVKAKQKQVAIGFGDSDDISNYFTIEQNGVADITSILYIDLNDDNKEISNTNSLAKGTHIIRCTVEKENGGVASDTVTIIVGEPRITVTTSIQSETTKYQDDVGNIVVVPGGFKVRTDLATAVQDGIVIEDGEGNQFVWVPIGDVTKKDGSVVTIEFGRYDFEVSHNVPMQYASNWNMEVGIGSGVEIPTTYGTNRESTFDKTSTSVNATALNLEKFITTTQINGGYYIARYEASFGSGAAINTVSSGISAITDQIPQFKQSNYKDSNTMSYVKGTLWNRIRQGDASLACRNLYVGNEYNNRDFVQCDLINGYAWDTAVVFIEKCSDKPNYSMQTDANNSLYNTGTDVGKTTDVVCNIYDMASNLREWTTEFSTRSTEGLPCIDRGAYYYEPAGKVFWREVQQSDIEYMTIGFRGVLYCNPALGESSVVGSLYRISDKEYHLIFNKTGNLAQGYTEEQLVAKGNDIGNGSSYVVTSEGKYLSNQVWGPYSDKITKVKIEEEIKPTSTAHYFRGLTQITEIEGLDNIYTNDITSTRCMFSECSSLISLNINDWNTSKVTNMVRTFEYCTSLTSIDLSNWDTSKVTDMLCMFDKCTNLTSVKLSEWNTGNVTNMMYAFKDCHNLINIDVSNWNTSNVTNMFGMFARCYKISSLDLSGWNTSKVTDMVGMFKQCSVLSKIYVGDKWSTSAVTTSGDMFLECTVLSGAMSYNASKINATYANWTTGYLTKIGVYQNLYKISDSEYHLILNTKGTIAEGYTESQLVVSGTNIENGSAYVTNSAGVNVSAQPWEPYKANITKIKIEEEIRPTSTAFYFLGLSKVTEIEGLNNIYTDNVTNMQSMISGCSSLTILDLRSWNTSNVTNMQYLFFNCSSLTSLSISNWDTSKVRTMQAIFNGCSALTSFEVGNWNVSNVTNMREMFSRCSSLTSIDLRNWNTSNVTDMYYTFIDCSNLKNINISNWDVSKVENMRGLFAGCYALESIDLSGWNTRSVTNMQAMFYNCTGLKKIYVGDNWNTSAVTNSPSMFLECRLLSGAISYDSTKSDVTYANYTTGYLTKVGVYGNLYKINNTEYHLIFNTKGTIANGYTESQLVASGANIEDGSSYATNSSGAYMSNQVWGPYSENITKVKIEEKIKPKSVANYFRNLPKITEVEGLDNIDTRNITNTKGLFESCSSLVSVDLSNWNTSKVTDMHNMFSYCSSLTSLNLSNWDTSKVTNMQSMFDYCSNLTKIYVGNKWTTNAVTVSTNMFRDCTSLRGAISYNSTKTDATYANYINGYLTYKAN